MIENILARSVKTKYIHFGLFYSVTVECPIISARDYHLVLNQLLGMRKQVSRLVANLQGSESVVIEQEQYCPIAVVSGIRKVKKANQITI
jgi:hypothetical protein